MGFPVFVCENNCGKELKPHCNMKIKNGKFYCKECYYELLGREEITEKFPKIFE
jgi:hypothetical protein